MYTKINNRICFTESADNFVLVISSGLKPIVKHIYIMSIICFTGMFFLFLYNMLLENSIILFGLCFLCISVSIVYLKRVSKKEIISINKTTISITQKDFIETKFRSYLISDVFYFRYAGENKFTSHSIGVNNFDYLVIQTTEKEIQNIIKDGTLEFFCNGERVRFGMDVPAWDAEEIISRIEKFTGNNLQIDDSMEQLLDELKDNTI
jgi:hypothetical protein